MEPLPAAGDPNGEGGHCYAGAQHSSNYDSSNLARGDILAVGLNRDCLGLHGADQPSRVDGADCYEV